MAIDVLVVGGGMAGASAALAARAAGASVALISRGPGATSLSSGAADFAALGDAPVIDAMRALAQRPGHPFALVSDLEGSLREAFDLLRDLGYRGPGDRNLWLLSPLGCPKPAALAQPFIAEGDLRALSPEARPAVVALAGAQAIEARLQAKGLRGLFPHAFVLPVEFYSLRSDALRGIPEMAADIDARRGELAGSLRKAARNSGATHLFVPTLGLQPQALDSGVPVFEMLGAPPSVPGLRLQRALEAALRAAQVEVRVGEASLADLPSAGAVVLATGRFIGGGIRDGRKPEASASHDQLHDAVFSLPAFAGDRRSLPALTGEELFALKASGRHAGLSAGLRVGPGLRALDASGKPAHLRGAPIFAAGAVVGGYDPARDEGGLGAAALLGLVAGKEAAASMRAPARAELRT